MSSLSNQQPVSPFSEYSELCKVTLPTVAAQPWDWQHPPSIDMDTHNDLMAGDGTLAATGLTDEDKLCFLEQPGRGSMDMELKVPGKGGGISGSKSLGNTSLGSAGESPLSSSTSPSPVSPSAHGSEATNTVSLPRARGSPTRNIELFSASSAIPPHSVGVSLMEASPEDEDSKPWNNSRFAEYSPKVAMPQVAPNLCVIGVVNSSHLDKGDKVAAGKNIFSEGNGDEEEMEEDLEELEPCFMGRAEQQRKAMRRAMSECSNLSVPVSLELADKYPGGIGAENDQLLSPMDGRRRSPHSMTRSLTVADDESLLPTLLAAGRTHTDLRQAPLEPRLCLSSLPHMKDGNACLPLSPQEFPLEGFKAGKEPADIVHAMPVSQMGFSVVDSCSALSVDSETESQTGSSSDMAKDGEFDGDDMKFDSSADVNFAGNKLTLMGNLDSDLATGGFTNQGSNPRSNPFITMHGRWRACLQSSSL